MMNFKWMNSKARSIIRYFNPNYGNTPQNREEGLSHDGPLLAKDALAADLMNASPLVTESSTVHEAEPQHRSISVYQVTAGVASLVINNTSL